jgi:phosphinothricin acetyltransferase
VTGSAQGRGIGARLLDGLVAASEAEGFWTLQAQIMAANAASRALHVRCGFREVGIRERLGELGGRWHDVVLYERRSTRTGGPGLPTRQCRTAGAA